MIHPPDPPMTRQEKRVWLCGFGVLAIMYALLIWYVWDK